MSDVVFWGATGQAKVLKEMLPTYDLKLVALIDNNSNLGTEVLGVPLLHGEAGFIRWLQTRGHSTDLYCCIAIGGNRGSDRVQLLKQLCQHGLSPVTLIHRTAFVAEGSYIGAGCQILAQAAVCTDAKLGDGVIVNTAASVDHECNLGDGVHIAPGARLAGEVQVGACAFIGTGAIILPRIRVGEGAVVGAGAVVTRDVPAHTTVVGNPANLLMPLRT